MQIKGYEFHKSLGCDITLKESDGRGSHTSDICQLLDQLLEPSPNSIKVVWNLDAFVAPLLKLLNDDICKMIASPEHKANFGVEGSSTAYSLYYLPDKLLSISRSSDGHNKIRAEIYGLNGFFDDSQPKPDSVNAMEELGNRLLVELAKIDIIPRRLTSPIGSFMTSHKLPDFPTINDTPDQFLGAQHYGEKCVGREWRENFQIGHWSDSECYAYDLSSAYASVAARLPDLRFAEYIFSSEFVPGAYWGFLRGVVTINKDVKISPIIMRRNDGTLINPVGSWETYLDLQEVQFIEREGIGSFQLKDGWFIKFSHVEKPLENLIEKLYRARTNSDPILNHYLKRVLSGVVGKLHEHHTETGLGDYFNPIYHSVITTAVRLRVGQLIYENQALDNIVRVNTDGLIADRALTIPTGKGLGKWRFVPPQATIVLSPELVFYGDKRPNSMTYATLRSLICKHPRSSLYEAKFNRRVTLLEAMRDKDLSRVGENITCSSHVDLTMLAQTQVRSFLKFPKTGEALIENKYKSEPIRIDIKPKLK